MEPAHVAFYRPTNDSERLRRAAGTLAGMGLGFPGILRAADTVKIGLSIPITGLQAILGETLLNCYKLAADQLNAKNGIAGRKIELVDRGQPDHHQGCCRQSAQADRRRQGRGRHGHDHLARAERDAVGHLAGQEAVLLPDQLRGWGMQQVLRRHRPHSDAAGRPDGALDRPGSGKTIYVMASDYAWPRKMTDAISAAMEKAGGKIVGADYYPFGTQDFGPAFQRIKDLKPDVVWSMVVGNDAVTQLKQYRSFDVKQPLIAPLDEVFNKDALPPGIAAGTYAPQPYWMAIDTPTNKAFIQAFRDKFGQEKMVNGIGEAGYNGMNLYALAAEKAGSFEDDKVLAALPSVEFNAPQGLVRIDPPTIIASCIPMSARLRATASATRSSRISA